MPKVSPQERTEMSRTVDKFVEMIVNDVHRVAPNVNGSKLAPRYPTHGCRVLAASKQLLNRRELNARGAACRLLLRSLAQLQTAQGER